MFYLIWGSGKPKDGLPGAPRGIDDLKYVQLAILFCLGIEVVKPLLEYSVAVV